MGNFSTRPSSEFAMLSPMDRERIMRDIGEQGIEDPVMDFAPSAYNQLKSSARAPIFSGGPGAQLVGAMGSPEADAAMAKSDQAPKGALSMAPMPQQDMSYDSAPQGALSVLPQQRQPFDLQKMIDQFAPRDDSASKYFAIAAALGKPTGFGTMGEKFANVAQALNEQKANQEKLRSQYVPIIMQQVAAQQARDEQAAYRAEAAMQAQQAAAQMQKERLASAQQAQQERLAQQAREAEFNRASAMERSTQHADLMRTLAGNKPEPAPQIITTSDGVFKMGRDGKLEQLKSPGTGAPLSGKPTGDQKPIPATIIKEQGDLLNQIGTMGGINSDLSELSKQLATGKLELGPVRNLQSTARNAVGMSDETSRNFATFKAKMENLRNATLLLNKGVQTEGDAQRAFNELFANLNDPAVVSQRLAEIQKLNERAAALKKNQVNVMRSEYGHPEMDFSKYENLPASVNLQKPAAVDDLINKYRSK